MSNLPPTGLVVNQALGLFTWNLPAKGTCWGRSAFCDDHCYACKGKFGFQTVKDSQKGLGDWVVALQTPVGDVERNEAGVQRIAGAALIISGLALGRLGRRRRYRRRQCHCFHPAARQRSHSGEGHPGGSARVTGLARAAFPADPGTIALG